MNQAGFLQRLLNVYPGEGRRVISYALVCFFTAVGMFGGLTIGDGLFLENQGVSGLSTTYLFIALLRLAVAIVTIRALSRFPIHKIFSYTVLVAASLFATAGLFHAASFSPHPAFWFFLRIIATGLMMIVYTGLWNFIDEGHALQKAKRLYGLFNASMILGGVCGNAMIWLMVNRVGPSGVLFLLASAYLLAVFLVRRIGSTSIPFTGAEYDPSHPSLYQTMVGSKFTVYLLTFSLVIILLQTVTTYNYMETLTETFGISAEGGNRLTRFLGSTQATIYLCNVIFGLFFYSRVIRSIGIRRAILIPGVIFFALFAVWVNHSSLIVGILGLIAVEGVLFGVEDSNFNLLISGVPGQLRAKIRVAIEQFSDPIAMLVSSLLLMAFSHSCRLLGLVIAGLCLLATWLLKSEYPKAIFRNLTAEAVRFDRDACDWLEDLPSKQRQNEISRLLTRLKEMDRECQILAIHCLLEFEDASLLPRLFERLEECEDETRITALDLLRSSSFSQDRAVAERLELWLQTSDREPLTRAVNTYLNTLAVDQVEGNPNWAIDQMSAMPSNKRTWHLRWLEGRCRADQVESLIIAAGHFRPHERRLVEDVIVGVGEEAIPPLLEIVQDPARHFRSRILASRTLAHLSRGQLEQTVQLLLPTEVARASFYYYHTHTVQVRHPNHDLHLLEDGLRSRFHDRLDLIVHLIGAAGGIGDCDLLCHSLRSQDLETHSNAVETLEKFSRRRSFERLLPLIDDRPRADKIVACHLEGHGPLSLAQIVEWLSQTPSPADQLLAGALKAQLGLSADSKVSPIAEAQSDELLAQLSWHVVEV